MCRAPPQRSRQQPNERPRRGCPIITATVLCLCLRSPWILRLRPPSVAYPVENVPLHFPGPDAVAVSVARCKHLSHCGCEPCCRLPEHTWQISAERVGMRGATKEAGIAREHRCAKRRGPWHWVVDDVVGRCQRRLAASTFVRESKMRLELLAIPRFVSLCRPAAVLVYYSIRVCTYYVCASVRTALNLDRVQQTVQRRAHESMNPQTQY